MPLTPGTRLGPFEIIAPLGAGGMGEVHRARDTRLGRDVAIKALPAAFAQDAERLARFEREARLLASLSHPNVAGIHGLEEVAGARYLVLEFVEGETLAARLGRGPLPLDEALDVARQIAAGVEAAHESGVVHRDLKPGNVMLTPSGAVKVLDFGLARSGAGEPPGSDPGLSASPTRTYAATEAGVILGTAAYMSPEQARGRAVDRRTDIWSFGCVLYECLTARQAFHGETVSDTIASILRGEADVAALPAATPARVRELIARCLCKDPRDRLRDIGEARILLARPDLPAAAAPAGPAARARGVPPWLAVAAALALAVAAGLGALLARARPAPAPLRMFDLVSDDMQMDWFFAPVLSPDGRRIAYIARNRLWIRDLEGLEPRMAAEIAGISPLCWSPDSRALAFNDRRKLWRVSVDGGAPVALCEAPGTGSVIGLSWARDGRIAFSSWRGGMFVVPDGGGAPAPLFDIDPATMVDFHYPSWLPNGDLLHLVHWKAGADSAGAPRPKLWVFTGGRRVPVTGGFQGDAPTPTGGMLLYERRDANEGIWAVRYEAAGRRVAGEPRLVAAGAASISVSANGWLLYMEGNSEQGPNELIWVDRSGKVLSTVGPAHPGLSDVQLSPDGRRIAFTVRQADNEDVWVRDLERGIDTRLTFSPMREVSPHWIGPARLTYIEREPGTIQFRVLAVNADGSGKPVVVAPATGVGAQQAFFAPDGRSAARILDQGGSGRLRISPVLADGSFGAPAPLLHVVPEPDVEEAGISPDGRLLAYATNDPGQPEVFLTRYPSGDGQWQVSLEGGRRARWSRGSGELVYIGGSGPSRRALVAVSIDAAQDPPVGTSTRLFDIDPRWLRFGEMPFDVGPDGKRFLMIREAPGGDAKPNRMVLVQNWAAALAKQPAR